MFEAVSLSPVIYYYPSNMTTPPIRILDAVKLPRRESYQIEY